MCIVLMNNLRFWIIPLQSTEKGFYHKQYWVFTQPLLYMAEITKLILCFMLDEDERLKAR